MEMVTSDWGELLKSLVANTVTEAYIVCPFVQEVAIDVFSDLRRRSVCCRLLTRLSGADIFNGVTRGEVLRELIDLGVVVKTRRGLHAKIYMFDRSDAVVTSSNLTCSGTYRNAEMGVHFAAAECTAVFDEAERWWNQSRRILTAAEVNDVLQSVAEQNAIQANPPRRLPDSLRDLSEQPSDRDRPDVVQLRPEVNAEDVTSLCDAFCETYEKADVHARVRDLQRALQASSYHDVPISNYLWLAGWCNTDCSRQAAMTMARALAESLFGYVPPESLSVAGHRYELKEWRYKERIPLSDELIEMHESMLQAARPTNTPVGTHGASQVLGPRTWRHRLENRERNFELFQVPNQIVVNCAIESNTKRKVQVRVPTGEHLEGFASITSGFELRIPRHVQPSLRRAKYFDCEILGEETSLTATLDLCNQPTDWLISPARFDATS